MATFISYEKRLQRTLTWTTPSPDPVPSVISYTATCSNQDGDKKSKVTTSGAEESAIIGSGSTGSENAPLEANVIYTCEVVANNGAGSSDPSAPTAEFAGGDLPKTGDFIVPKSVVPEVANIYEDVYVNGQWKVGLFTGAGGNTAISGTGKIMTSPLEALQQPPTSIIELTTPCDQSQGGGYGAGVRATFLPSIFGEMKFGDFLADFHSIEYKYYKVSGDCEDDATAAPTFKLTLYPPYAQLIWTPNRAPPLNGGDPDFDQWYQVNITKASGSVDFAANGGWYDQSGTRMGVDNSLGASLQKWEDYLTSSADYSSFLDANVYQIAVEVGSGEGSLVTYINDIRISSGDYDWSFTFEAPEA